MKREKKQSDHDESKAVQRTADEAVEIDYSAEGSSPPESEEKNDETDRGYDQAAHSGPSRYGVPEGNGGVFGTSGGGSYAGGFQVVERPGVYNRKGEQTESTRREGSVYGRESDTFDQVNTAEPKSKKKSD